MAKAKQRKNRERATELMKLLDELVPAMYPYRAFTSTGNEGNSLRKRSRNRTLEDVINAVAKAKARSLEVPPPRALLFCFAKYADCCELRE